jgi:hypothetical protein
MSGAGIYQPVSLIEGQRLDTGSWCLWPLYDGGRGPAAFRSMPQDCRYGLPYQRPKDDDENRSAGSRIKTGFRGACKRAGIKDFHPHDCRHVFATWHYAHNRDLTALMKLGGWRDIKSVSRYTHASVDEFRDTMDRLPGGNLGDPSRGELKIGKNSTA